MKMLSSSKIKQLWINSAALPAKHLNKPFLSSRLREAMNWKYLREKKKSDDEHMAFILGF